MEPYRLYFQRIDFNTELQNGLVVETYTWGEFVNIYQEFGILCSENPLKLMDAMKDYATHDWMGEDGTDVYVPAIPRLKSYDIQFSFLYEGLNDRVDDKRGFDENMRLFLEFLHSGRLCFYEEYTRFGRKDVVLSSFSDDGVIRETEPGRCIAKFKLTFKVHDPVTEVFLNQSQNKLIW